MLDHGGEVAYVMLMLKLKSTVCTGLVVVGNPNREEISRLRDMKPQWDQVSFSPMHLNSLSLYSL